MKRIGACVLSGILGFLGFVGFDQFYLQYVFLVPCLWAIRDLSPRRAFFLGWLAGTVGHAGGFYWMGYTIELFGQLPAIAGWAGVVGIAAANGVTLGIWAWLTRRCGWSIGWFAAVAWVAVEHAYPFVFQFYLGAGQYPVLPLLQIADLTGPLGISFLVVLANAALFEATQRRFRMLPICAGVFALCYGYGAWRIADFDERVAKADTLRVGIVQANMGAGDRHRNAGDYFSVHQLLTTQLEEKEQLDLVVWPENIFSLAAFTEAPAGLRGAIRAPLLTGASFREDDGRRYGTALLIGTDNKLLGRYDKRKLIPFAEKMPFGIEGWSTFQGELEEGVGAAPIQFGKHRLGVCICYEDIFPGLVRDVVDDEVDLLVNVTNDSWYGNTHEPLQHLVLASLRAIEHRRAMVRATNTGMSAFIDPVGRIDSRTEQWVKATPVADVPLLRSWTLFGAFGNWFGYLCLIVAFAGLFARRPIEP